MSPLKYFPACATATAFALATASAHEVAPLPEAAFGPQVDQEKGYLVEEIGDGLYFVTEGIYQIIFLTTGEGVIVVDAPPSLGENILKAIAEVTDEPITHVVYSHAHGDHIGAASLYPDDARIIAHAETKAILERGLPCLGCVAPRPLPTETFTERMRLEVGNQALELEYRDVNHQAGNIFIYAPRQRTLMLVDVVFPGWVPFRQLAIAEDPFGFIQAHDDVLSFDFETFIGGHLTRHGTRADVEAAREYVLDVRDNAQQAIQTVNLQEVIGPIGQEIGFEHLWHLFGGYQDAVNAACTQATLAKWGDRLGDAAIFTPSHCQTLADSLRVD